MTVPITMGRAGWVRTVRAVARVGLRSEARNRSMLAVWLTLGLLLLAVVFITMSAADVEPGAVAPSALWLVFALIGTLAVGRGHRDANAEGAWRGLVRSPAPSPAVFLGLFAANVVVTLVAELAVIVGYSLAVRWPGGSIALLVTVILGTVGIVAVGTFAVAVLETKGGSELLLPIMVLPVVLPVIALSAQLTRVTLAGPFTGEWAPVLALLVGYDLILILGCAAAFGFVTSDA